jgi:hypothetical protein
MLMVDLNIRHITQEAANGSPEPDWKTGGIIDQLKWNNLFL